MAKPTKRPSAKLRRLRPARSKNADQAKSSQYEADLALRQYQDMFITIEGFVYASVIKGKDGWQRACGCT
jgi:hypothetical protein